MTTYDVRLRIEDANGKRVETLLGGYVYVSDVKYQMYVHNIDVLGERMKAKHDEIMLTLPNDYKVFLTALRYNSISSTWMEMAAYYGGEKRFVVFT
jgi:hypothetical protein